MVKTADGVGGQTAEGWIGDGGCVVDDQVKGDNGCVTSDGGQGTSNDVMGGKGWVTSDA